MDEKPKVISNTAIWQIYLPLLVGSGAIIGLGVWAASAAASGTDVSRFADVSAVLLLIPVFIIALIPLALLGGLVYGVTRLMAVIPKGSRRGQQVMERVRRGVQKGSEIAVAPILHVKGFGAGLRAVWKKKSTPPSE